MLPDPDLYTRVMTSPGIVNLMTPADSRLIAKGPHIGPAFESAEIDTILNWIGLEVIARGGPVEPPRETDAFSPALNQVNTVDLAALGLPGSTLTFFYERITGGGAYLSDIQVNAGPDGVRVVHPLFVVWNNGVPAPDESDSFGYVDLRVEAGMTSFIGGGTLVLVDLPLDAQVSIQFVTAETLNGGGGGGGDGGVLLGCQATDAFTANARQPLANSCGTQGCHGTPNTAAANTTDMTRLGDLAPDAQLAACGQILSRINLPDPNNSGIFIAADAASGTQHPVKLNAGDFQGFKNALTIWIAAEQAARQ